MITTIVYTIGQMVAASTLSVLHAVVLGLVEGITEFLPVSSTGHLLVAQRAMGLASNRAGNEALDAYAICIQAGAILAVVALYPRRVLSVVSGVIRPGDGRHLLVALATAFAPAAIVGAASSDVIQRHLFGFGPVVVAWIAGGVAMLFVSRTAWAQGGTRQLEQLALGHAAAVGLAQVIALWPGVSRSLTTILAALVLGYSMRTAIEFSFLLGLVTLAAATAFSVLQNGSLIIATFGTVVPLVGVLVAFISAAVTMRWMVSFLSRDGLRNFGWYRIAIAVVTLAWLSAM